MPEVSIIVPVYNVEKYLHRCVDSILAQTFTDFELILVDDGSPDNCPAICDAYAAKDNRVRVFHQENNGVSTARNFGIELSLQNSESKWIAFIDSDDWIHPRMLELLVSAATKYEVSVSVCGYESTGGEMPVVNCDRLSIKKISVEDFFVESNINFVVPWGKLYKKEVFQEIRYPIGKRFEDEFTTYRVLFQHPELAFIDAPLYNYYTNPSSFMNTAWSPMHTVALDARNEQIDYFTIHGFKKARIRAEKAIIWEAKRQIDGIRQLTPINHTALRHIRILLRKNIRQYKSDLSLSLSKDSGLYEAAYPKFMQLYWLFRTALRKLHIEK